MSVSYLLLLPLQPPLLHLPTATSKQWWVHLGLLCSSSSSSYWWPLSLLSCCMQVSRIYALSECAHLYVFSYVWWLVCSVFNSSNCKLVSLMTKCWNSYLSALLYANGGDISYSVLCHYILGKHKLSPSAEHVGVVSSVQYEDVEPHVLPQPNLTQPSTLSPFEEKRGGGTGNNVVLEENPFYQSL